MSTTGPAGRGRRSWPLTVVGSLRPSGPSPSASTRSGAWPGRPRRPGPASRLRPRTGPGWELAFGGPWTGSAARARAARPADPAGPGGAPRRAAPLRRLDHRPAGAGRLLGRDPAALGVLADRAAPARLRARPSGHQRGLAGLDRFTINEDAPDGPVRRLEACQSPVWDTVLAMIALADAGLPPEHPALTRAAGWLLDEEIPGPGDWQVRRPGWPPAAGRSSSTTTATPTSTTPPKSCSRCAAPDPSAEAAPGPKQAAIGRGLRWITGMQSADGGWGAFDADNTPKLVTSCRSATSARSSTRPRPT